MNEEEREAIYRITKLYENSLDINKTLVVLTEDTRCLEILLNLVDKQNKIIDLMAGYLANEDTEETICKYIECKADTEEINCIDCIKKYFKKKVEEE